MMNTKYVLIVVLALSIIEVRTQNATTEEVTTVEVTTTDPITDGPTTSTTSRAPITDRPSTTRRPTRRTTKKPRCQRRCSRQGPALCASNRLGICRKFANTCDLRRVNCEMNTGSRYNVVCPMRCPKDMRIGERRRCMPMCPPRGVRCKSPPSRSSSVCLRRRTGNSCRLVASRCEMHRLNCQWPRGAWVEAHRSECRNMKMGDQARRCRKRD